MHKIYLASGSPRRREILENLGYTVLKLPAGIDESPLPNETAVNYVLRMACEKNADAVSRWQTEYSTEPEYPLLSADTVVALQNHILGKPESSKHAYEILSKLSGTTHQVLTAVCIYWQGRTYHVVQQSDVEFKVLNHEEISAYIASGEPMDKAGAYGIQGIGGIFVENLKGSFTGVMGLPVFETISLLKTLNIDTPPFRRPE
ncbi:Maf family protein [Neisseria montereyensis]|uniref:dTTP/UTP pyrophosphatase n=1 Tax=Neisseria montereyensis TaxID=2973938 RepID=A0ABT2FAT5_9NEIS|nr:Maf family nucleotide pyrophosphatase [Neisseria montereyensis]MCS4533331.1 Maf family nucleotide pyrophosphatase [Neisseria montereyensis]